MAGLTDDPSLRSRRPTTTSLGAARREHNTAEDFAELCRSLSDHVLRRRQGGRIDALPLIVEDPDPETCSGDPSLTRSAYLLRHRVTELERRIGRTDKVIAEWLSAHRAPEAAPENSVFTTEPWGDPVLLLIWHIQGVLENVRSRGGVDDGTLRQLDAQLTKPFDALRSEIAAVDACASASIQYANAAVNAALT